jgi:penicillin-binding protein 2
VPGHDVQLTIDINVQKEVEDSLEQGLDQAHKTWDPNELKYYIAPAGAVVVEDPRDGSLLAMASFPTYNPADFAGGISSARFATLQDPANSYPLNNRAIQGEYAPGSTFKMVTAMTALGQDVIAPNTTINDTGSIMVGNQPYRNAFGTAYGSVNLTRALTVSSDVYFYQLGEKLDTAKAPFPLPDEARSFGLSKPTNVDLPFEADGFVPDPDLKKKRHDENPTAFPYGDWFEGDNVNLAVGQGDLVVTPLQLANAYSAFANGGTIWAPHVGGVIRNVTTNQSTPVEARQIGKVDMRPADHDAVLAGLQRVTSVDEGTASAAFAGFPLGQFPVAGKTGTAEVAGKQETALFVGFGPVDAPRYVVTTVMEESGLGASAAAPVVRRIFDGLIGNPPQPVARVGGHD